jgi:hypothetical protein
MDKFWIKFVSDAGLIIERQSYFPQSADFYENLNLVIPARYLVVAQKSLGEHDVTARIEPADPHRAKAGYEGLTKEETEEHIREAGAQPLDDQQAGYVRAKLLELADKVQKDHPEIAAILRQWAENVGAIRAGPFAKIWGAFLENVLYLDSFLFNDSDLLRME